MGSLLRHFRHVEEDLEGRGGGAGGKRELHELNAYDKEMCAYDMD